ncbi:alpha/beta fold hydrolase [Corallincola luteus]|uniref:alpha/beta fold hydrolase n=1 Tax=Corallincola luteus TaxID=1775177 RepID=UPI0013F49E86|nr:alpha/beta hydrolase [Corallincola luteus]
MNLSKLEQSYIGVCKKVSWVALVILFSINVAIAGGFNDKLKAALEDVKGKVDEYLALDEPLPAPSSLPDFASAWHAEYVLEPAFNSHILKIEAGQANDQTIILVHGLGSLASQDWLAQIPALAKHYHVIAIDLPGFGFSRIQKGKMSPSLYAKTLHWVNETYAHGASVVIGHSMGGAIALRYASDFPVDVKQLVIINAAGILERTAFIKSLATLPLDNTLLSDELRRVIGDVQNVSDAWLESIAGGPDPTAPLNASDTAWSLLLSDTPNINAALALVNDDFSDVVRKIAVPTTIIWGRQDGVAPLRTGEVLEYLIPASRLYVLNDAQHVPMKSHAQVINELILKELSYPPETELSAEPVDLANSDVDLLCKGKSGVSYRGVYRHITFDNCSNIRLESIKAQSLTLKQSKVKAKNLIIMSNGTGVTITQSVLEITNGQITAPIGFQVSDSRVDVAGVSVVGTSNAISVEEPSLLIMSLSRVTSPTYKGNAHGHFSMEKKTISELLLIQK